MNFKPKKFALIKERFDNKAGTVVYDAKYHDYGLANDDTRITGIQHVSVSLNSLGDYPLFTVPKDDLKEID